MIDILAIGNLVWETTALVPALPGEGEPLPDLAGALAGSRALVRDGGGSAANTLVVAARLGLRCVFVGVAGDDPEGEAAETSLRAAGVRVSVRRVPGRRTKRNTVFVEAGTARTVFRTEIPGLAAPPVQPEDVPADLLRSARVLHLDRVSRTGVALALARAAAGRGLANTLDLHTFPFRSEARVRLASLLPALAVTQASEAASQAFPAGHPVPWMVVTRGAAGATARAAGGEPFDVPPEPVAAVLDPTGAGDAFAAGLVQGLLAGARLEDACRIAARLGAVACSALGARGAWKPGA